MSTPVTGHTSILPLLAYPASHIRTPSFMNPALAARGIDALVVPWQVAPPALGEVVQAMRRSESVAGLIATVPHKTALPALCDTLTTDAEALGAVNVVRRGADGALHGGTLDGEGFVSGLVQEGHALDGRSVLLLGAGGAGAAIALALCRHPIKRLIIANRSIEKAQDLARLVTGLTGTPAEAGPADPAAADVVVNATVLGMRPDDPLPVTTTSFRPGQLVAEAVMQPAHTRLLETAQAQGAATHAGEHMIRAQIDRLIDFLFEAS